MKKLLYIALLSVLGLFCVSCFDDATINSTGTAVVSMAKTAYQVKENKGLFYIPILVSGERNGDVEVDIEVTPSSANCQENVHYLVTSKHLVIPAHKNSVNVEIKAIDDRSINEDRSFMLIIKDVKGAVKADSDTQKTLITLLDNDNIPYDRIDGTWIVTAVNRLNSSGVGDSVSWNAQLRTVPDEDGEGYGTLVTMSPWRMWNGDTYEGVLPIQHTLSFRYNASSQTATLNLKLGEVMASEFALGGENEDGLNLTSCTLLSATPTSLNYTTNGNLVGTVNEDFTKITFNLPLMGLLLDANNTPFSYWFWYEDIVLTKK